MRFFQPTRSLIMGTRLTFIISLYCSICSAAEPINLGSKREIFIDNHLIESLEGTELRLSKPRDEGPVHKFNSPGKVHFAVTLPSLKTKNDTYSITVAYHDQVRMELTRKPHAL